MQILFKIMTVAEWRQMGQQGEFGGSAADRRDGFIHLSAAHQVRETAARHFAGQSDLMLVAVRDDSLADLRWEVSRGGDLFPHVFGVLPMTAVAWAQPLPWNDGVHQFPQEAGL